MENLFSQLPEALGIVLSLDAIWVMTLGVVAGIIIGVLPGFGGAQALALMFPFTLSMSVEQGTLLLVSTYVAAEYGGSIPAILIRTPGTTAAAITVLDGYPMAQQGKAGRALYISLIAGVYGGILSAFLFVGAAGSLAWVGLQFGPAEMFAVGVFGLTIIAGFMGSDIYKGLLAVGIGLILSMIGSSGFAGMRFTFGQASLLDGVPLIILVIGLMAMPEIFSLMTARKGSASEFIDPSERAELEHRNRLTLRDVWRLVPSMTRGSLIGTVIGIIPGPGATVSSLVAYSEEKRWSKNGAKFGTGVDEGVASPEAANNAVVAGALVPALALGIPGSGAIAILMALLISKGIAPGPLLFRDGGPLVYAVFLCLIAASLINLAVGAVGMRIFSLIARVPRHILAPFVLVLVIVGTYSYQFYMAHVYMVLAIGILGVVLEKTNVPTVAIVLAFVMGPIIEQNLSRGLAIHNGDLLFLISRPIPAGILIASVIAAVVSFRRGREHKDNGGDLPQATQP